MSLQPFAIAGSVTLTPSGDRTGLRDAAAIMAAAAAFPASSPGLITLASGIWYINGGQVAINRSGIYISAAGCLINAVGAGDAFRIYDSSNYNGRTVYGGGIIGFPVIDGTATTGAAAGVHTGDILQLQTEVYVQNFTQPGSIGVRFNNANFWTEQLFGRIYAQNCASHVVFDVTGALTSTGSYARADLGIYIDQVNAAYNGVVLQNGALIYDGALALRGNFGGSASVLTSAALTLTGTVPAGHPDAGNFSGIHQCRLDIGLECGTAAHTPSTIAVGSASNSVGFCYGIMDFTANFTPAAGPAVSAVYPFNGYIAGDPGLATVSGYPFGYTWNIPGGIAVGNFAGPAVPGTGGTISTAGTGLAKTAPAGNITGVILQAGTFDGQQCTIANESAFTITFAAAGTSHVADGAGSAIAATTARQFIWDGNTNLWYRCA